MKLEQRQILNTIKIISTVAITGALGLLGADLYLQLQGRTLPDSLNTLFWLGNLALTAHAIQGAIAAFKVISSDRNPWSYGIYTFFVGSVALKELEER